MRVNCAYSARVAASIFDLDGRGERAEDGREERDKEEADRHDRHFNENIRMAGE